MTKYKRIETFVVSASEYSALTDIFGPPPDVHYMIMGARPKGKQWILKGSSDTMDELRLLLDEEIHETNPSASRLKILLRLLGRLEPEYED